MKTSKIYENFLPENGKIIAETACNHGGKIVRLFKLIDSVSKSNTNLIKFQVFLPEERVNKNHKEYEKYNMLSISEKNWIKASNYALKKDLIIFADVFGEKSLEISKKMNVSGYKIHSGDLLNSNFIFNVTKTNKIILLGVGGSHRKEIVELLEYLKKNNQNKYLILMPGIQTFPTPLEIHCLDEIRELKEKYLRFKVKVGFADHVAGDKQEASILPLMAFASGACLVEKHITIDRKNKWVDYESSLDKENFKNLTILSTNLCKLLLKKKNFTKYDIHYRKEFKKSVFSKHAIKKSSKINFNNICFKKTSSLNNSLSSLSIKNRRVNSNIKSESKININNLVNKVGAVIVVRCSGERLPNKAIVKIQGRETIALLIDRIKKCKYLDCIILATSIQKEDVQLEKIAKREKIGIYRGSIDNVVQRIYLAAKKYNLDHVVRVTGDDVLRDELMIDKAILSHLKSSSDVTITKNMPYGTSTEIISIDTLKKVVKYIQVPQNSEYLEYIIDNKVYFNVNYIYSKYTFDKTIRMALKYKEDLLFFNKIFNKFYKQHPNFTIQDVLDYLKSNNKIIKINNYKKDKLKKSLINTKLNF